MEFSSIFSGDGIFAPLMETITVLLGSGLAALSGFVIHFIAGEFKHRTKSRYLKELSDRIEEAVIRQSQTTIKTAVRALADGKIDGEERAGLLLEYKMAKKKALAMVKEEALNTLAGMPKRYAKLLYPTIESKIEKKVLDNKVMKRLVEKKLLGNKIMKKFDNASL